MLWSTSPCFLGGLGHFNFVCTEFQQCFQIQIEQKLNLTVEFASFSTSETQKILFSTLQNFEVLNLFCDVPSVSHTGGLRRPPPPPVCQLDFSDVCRNFSTATLRAACSWSVKIHSKSEQSRLSYNKTEFGHTKFCQNTKSALRWFSRWFSPEATSLWYEAHGGKTTKAERGCCDVEQLWLVQSPMTCQTLVLSSSFAPSQLSVQHRVRTFVGLLVIKVKLSITSDPIFLHRTKRRFLWSSQVMWRRCKLHCNWFHFHFPFNV